MRKMRLLLLPVAVLATSTGCNEILGLDERHPFPETSPSGTGGSSSVSSSSTGGGGQGGGTGTGGAGGVMCDPDTGIGCGVHVWSKIFGGVNFQYPSGIASDAQGNVYIVGTFLETIDFGGTPLVSAGFGDAFLVKFDPTGNHLWSKRFGDSQIQNMNDLAVDINGNVAIAGYFTGAIDFGNGFIQGDNEGNMFVAKFDTNGNLLWGSGYGDLSLRQEANGVAIDESGNVIVLGYFEGTLGPLTATGGSDIFLMKLSSLEGNIVWAKKFGDASDQSASAVAVDTSGSIVIVGHLVSGMVNFGGMTLEGNVFVARFDTNGNHAWSKDFSASILARASDVATDSLGSVVLTGYYRGTFDLGQTPISSVNTGSDAYVAKFSVVGEPLWSYGYGSSGEDINTNVAVDTNDDIIISGEMSGAVDFGGGALPFGGADDVFLAKFSSEGVHRWSRSFGNENNQRHAFVAGGGTVLFACSTEGTISFGGAPLTSAGDNDVAVVKFTP